MTAAAPQRRIEKALVLGGAGFIGGYLVRELVGSGVAVISVDRDPRRRLAGTGAQSVQADISAADPVLGQHLADAASDVIFVLIGTGFVPRSLENPIADLVSNVEPLLLVLEAARRRRAPPLVVYLSSMAVYGEARELPMNERHSTAPLSPYGVSKLAAEQYLRLYRRMYGVPGIALRLFSVFGPGQRKLVIYDLLARLMAGEDPLAISGDPDVMRDYVYVGDVARCAHRLARLAPADGEPYNICSGTGTTLQSLAEKLRSACGSSASITFTGGVRSGDPRHVIGDPSAAAVLGARCDAELGAGLKEITTWLRRTGW